MFPSYEELIVALRPHIEELEADRAGYRRTLRQGLVVIAIAVALSAATLLTGYGQAIVLTGIVGLTAIIVTAFFLMRRYAAFRRKFKDILVTGIVRELVGNCSLPNETSDYEYRWNYLSDYRISDSHIRDCCLFEERIDEIDGEDLFQGRLGLTDFEFSELRLVRIERRTNAKGQQTTRRVTVFDGVLFVADFHKSFRGVTLLLTNGFFGGGSFLNRIGNALGNAFRSVKINHIKLENDDFNRLFITNTTDEVEARYILSANFMERLLKFKEAHPQKVEAAFVGSKMYVAISSGSNYFEPNIRRPVDRQVRRIRDEFVFFFGLIELFDLNTRIWSK
ncbi:hypothetical protein IJ21_31540 [Paenibacillus sp. 32O-W]|uniref:DUF3137 domain-containing protein n=1 Tax=Paenibacillus sp. 32O-W TaxID=1695218 RepID=UPI000722C39D|nr:DUF3137 domain-containing protein [Paenibacillus sp. 32O-W]ALS28548.1 hypothetical protein IJ21_31540 [Paenibacillus sp. 32O-W]